MATLAEKITRTSSIQTYITIKLLVDKSLVQDCLRAYAYLRWIDNQVDVHYKIRKHCLDFIERQKRIINDSYLNMPISGLLPEENMIVELIATNRDKNSKLGSFILNIFKLIEFDAYRKNTQITQEELDWYTGTLSIAVTDGIEYFINHTFAYPDSSNHYFACKGAHIVHMLRDYRQDIDAGFINIPKEYLCQHQLEPNDIYAPAFRNWVKKQVLLAKNSFYEGKTYIKRLPVVRGKIAALWYCARFEGLLDTIQKDGYILRSHYTKQSNLLNSIRMFGIAVQVVVFHLFSGAERVTI
jgi:phytoene/squalene synthetase